MNRTAALRIATDYVARLGRKSRLDFALDESATEERDFGWIFFYRSAGSDLLAGNAPLIVDRRDGSIHVTGTARPLEEYLDEFARLRGVSRA